MKNQQREAQFEELFRKASAAGQRALEACRPRPMVVSGGGREYYVPDGVCGFAYVRVRPGNCPFARFLKKKQLARPDSYYGGVAIYISAGDQSYEKKMAYATAMAAELQLGGVPASADGRLD